MTPAERAEELYWQITYAVLPTFDESIAIIQNVIEAAVAEEREACAMVAVQERDDTVALIKSTPEALAIRDLIRERS